MFLMDTIGFAVTPHLYSVEPATAAARSISKGNNLVALGSASNRVRSVQA
jgi:hypothetical protein